MIDPHWLVETHAGQDAHVRVKRVDQSEVTMIRSWGAQERVAVDGPEAASRNDRAAACDAVPGGSVFDKNLRLQSSPIEFRRTDKDEIIVPGRWLVAKLEEVSRNPVAPPELQRLALQLSRHGMLDDVLLPPEAETLALTVQETEGPATIIEALPAGQVITMRHEEGPLRARLGDGISWIRRQLERLGKEGA
jgi:hypothetical protein